MEEEQLRAFLWKLSELSRQFGIAICGDPQLFLMDPEDYWFDYAADGGDKLVRN